MTNRVIGRNFLNVSLLKDCIHWIECLLKDRDVDDRLLVHLLNTGWHCLSAKTDSELINQLICVRLFEAVVN